MSDILLDEVEEFLGRFVAFPCEHTRTATVLWAAHTHLLEAFESTPRLAFLSPEPGSGKSRSLEVLELLVPNPVMAVNVTPAYLFRKVGGDEQATILFDEIDTVFGPKVVNENQEVRGLLNAGHRRGTKAGRCVVRGKVVETEEIEAFAAVAIAGLGDSLPDTIMTRSVVVRMRRRAPNERVEPFRHRVHADEGYALRSQLEAWAASITPTLANVWPTMPAGIEDRNADVWEALVKVADAAGGVWPDRARVAAVTLVTQSGDRAWTLGVRLLADLRDVFGDEDALHTETILDRLHNLDESTWADLRGKPLDSRGLARRLRPYDVEPKLVRLGDDVRRGYVRGDLHDAWVRYLPPAPVSPEDSVTSVTPATCDHEPNPWNPCNCSETTLDADELLAAFPGSRATA